MDNLNSVTVKVNLFLCLRRISFPRTWTQQSIKSAFWRHTLFSETNSSICRQRDTYYKTVLFWCRWSKYTPTPCREGLCFRSFTKRENSRTLTWMWCNRWAPISPLAAQKWDIRKSLHRSNWERFSNQTRHCWGSVWNMQHSWTGAFETKALFAERTTLQLFFCECIHYCMY